MKLKIGDEVYAITLDTILIREAKEIKRQTGLTFLGLTRGLDDLDPDAIQAVIWLAKTRTDNSVVDWDSLESVDMASMEFIDDEEDGEGEDPTEGADAPGTSMSTDSSPSGSSPSPSDGTGAPTSSTE